MAVRFVTKLQKHLLILVGFSFTVAVVLGYILLSKESFTKTEIHPKDLKGKLLNTRVAVREEKPTNNILNIKKDIDSLVEENEQLPKPDYRVHVFYYPWYANPEVDGKYVHWNHEYMQHWNKQEAERWPKGNHKPPEDIGANFYPELGPYSSMDRGVVTEHMKQIRRAGIGVLSVSWYPPGLSDRIGTQPDSIIPMLLELAHQYQLKVCLHIEPYQGRTAETMRKNLEYAFKRYGSHPAYYMQKHKGKNLPIYYVYDSYMVKVTDWKDLLTVKGAHSIRDKEYDGIIIGLLVEEKHGTELLQAGFDGFYTYFASHGFTYGSSTFQWKQIATFAQANDMLFIPSCGPGYVDTRVRPWNARNTKSRNNGDYYEKSWSAALNINPPLISITSFNEWHEGTQIEPAVPKSIQGYKYEDYQPHSSDFYLSLTRKWIFKFNRHKRNG